jgi:peptide/nickel transport system permease protein
VIARRIASALVVIVLVSIAVFLMMRVIPGDPARLVMGPLASEAAVESMRRQMGLDQPLWHQYFTYVAGLLTGDWGTAWHTRQPVAEVLASRLPASLELAFSALIVAVPAGVGLGTLAAFRPDSALDYVIRSASIVILGTPPFWLGLVLILLMFTVLGLVPPPFERLSSGLMPTDITGFAILDSMIRGDLTAFKDALGHLVLPTLTLALPLAAWLAMIARRSVIDASQAEYIKTARSKGASETRILYHHALPNALLPILTLSTLALGDMIAGSIMVETVFSWPGVGGFVTESIVAQDFAPVQAIIILGAVFYSMINFLADVLYGLADPRVRLE